MSTTRRRLGAALAVLFAGLIALMAADAHADVFRAAYLELREVDAEHYEVLLRVPAQDSGARLDLDVEFPDDVQRTGPPQHAFVGNTHTQRFAIAAPGGLAGKRVGLSGRATSVTDVVARVERSDGTTQVTRLRPGEDSFEVLAPLEAAGIAWSYTALGFEHILGGIDHLLFVLSLLLVVREHRRIVWTITAFTLAHSLTLGIATLGLVHVPGPPVEAIIALSIVFVAAEAVRSRDGHEGLTSRAPWIVAFSFGLLHGFGFAGALAEVGLPDSSIPLALLTFNVGVELGQLAFVLCTLALLAVLRRATRFRNHRTHNLETLAAYAIGGGAAYWVIERVCAFW